MRKSRWWWEGKEEDDGLEYKVQQRNEEGDVEQSSMGKTTGTKAGERNQIEMKRKKWCDEMR